MFIEELLEALKPHQIQQVDDWTKKRKIPEKLSAIFGNSERIVVPFKAVTKIKPNRHVKDFLTSHGFTITDYIKGLCQKEGDKREFSIGKVLAKLNADFLIVKWYTNDPVRKSVNNYENLNIVYSINKYDIAAMSTDRGWTSCMNLNGGIYCNLMEDDLKYGTIIAYLVKSDDIEIENPIGRILIKPFVCKETKDLIWRPETKIYGSAPNTFLIQVEKWCDKKFPLDNSKIYFKHPNVYDDDDNGIIYNTKNLTDEQLIYLIKHGDISVKTIFNQIKNPSEEVQLGVVSIDPDIIVDIKNPSEKVQLAVIKQSINYLQYIENPTEKVQLTAVKKYPNSIRFIENPSEKVQLAAVRTDGDALEYIENPSEQVKMAAIWFMPKAIKWIKNPSPELQLTAVKRNYTAIDAISKPTLETQMYVVRKNPDMILFIRRPYKAVIDYVNKRKR